MNYAQYLEKGKTIESTESLIEKVINSQGQDENALQELVNRAQSQDSKAIEFLQMLQQQSGVSKFEEPSGPIVKKDQQDPNMPVAAETGTVDGRKYTYMPYQGEGRGPINRFEYIGQDGNTYGMTIQGPDTTYVMNGQQYNDLEGQRVIKERRTAVVREKCGGSVKKKETGDKITRKKVMAKGGCPCMIKKVGGRLIEVDSCTGLPVHRNGGNVVKLQTAWTTIPTMQMPYNPEAHRDPLLDSIIRTDMARKQAAKQEAEKAQLEREASARAAFDGSFMAGGLNYGKSNPLNLTRTAAQKTDVPSYIITDLSTLRPSSTREVDPSAENGTQNKADIAQSQKGAESTISRPLFADPNLRSLAQRQQWVKNNKDYLSANGWTEDEINNYRGQTAAINYKLRDAINGKSAWDAEQEAARQAEVAQRTDDQQRQQKFAEQIAPSHPLEKAAIISPKTPAIVKPQGLQPTAEQIKSNTLTAMLGQNTSDRRLAKYGKAYDFIKTGANSANMSAADTRRANRLATKLHRAGLMENGGQFNYANYLN